MTVREKGEGKTPGLMECEGRGYLAHEGGDQILLEPPTETRVFTVPGPPPPPPPLAGSLL